MAASSVKYEVLERMAKECNLTLKTNLSMAYVYDKDGNPVNATRGWRKMYQYLYYQKRKHA